MQIINSIGEMKSYIRETKKAGRVIGFVPTMGYLHEGHLTLIREAKKKCSPVVVSIFVNPLQFGVNEDYEEYPRDLSRDSRLAESAGADVIFAPTVREMYPVNYQTFVEVEKITTTLCGASRPGHFKGVATVVAKLFNIVEPDYAYFGQKDAQQVLVIKQMAADLNMNPEIIAVPIVREADGLAMSSRNAYLSREERKAALILSRSLREAEELIGAGETDAGKVIGLITERIAGEPLARIDYIEIKSWPDLMPVEKLAGEILIALAVFIGKTRLIDNILVEVQ